jgi:putative transposase
LLVPYWRLYYHLVWATRGREPLIEPGLARVIERSIRATGHDLNVIVHAVGVMPDHVHVVASIPPGLAIGTVVGRMKGAASHLANRSEARSGDAVFAWQGEYGVLSFGERALADVVAYVENQPSRHRADGVWTALEQVDEPVVATVHAPPSTG